MLKFLSFAIFLFISGFGTEQKKQSEPPPAKIKRVVAIALDGVNEKDIVQPMTNVAKSMKELGYEVFWYGEAQNCKVSQPYNLSLPAYATFFSGKQDRRIRNNWWKGKVFHKTLFDMYPNSQLFSGWGPIKNVMARTLGALNHGNILAKGINEDQRVFDGFFRLYNGSRFSFVHFVDADDFAHMRLESTYHTIAEQEAYRTLEIMQYVDKRNNKDTLFVIFSDHARGEGKMWHSHGVGIPGSEKMWVMIVTPTAIEWPLEKCNHIELHDFIIRTLE